MHATVAGIYLLGNNPIVRERSSLISKTETDSLSSLLRLLCYYAVISIDRLILAYLTGFPYISWLMKSHVPFLRLGRSILSPARAFCRLFVDYVQVPQHATFS